MKKIPLLMISLAILILFNINTAMPRDIIPLSSLEIIGLNNPGPGDPGTSVSGTFKVTNTGATRISSILFSATNLTSGSNVISANSITFSPSFISTLDIGNTSETITFTVNVPSNQRFGTYRGEITVKDATGNVSGKSQISVIVNPKKSLDVLEFDAGRPFVLTGEGGKTTSGTFKIRNTGNVDISPQLTNNVDLKTDRGNITLTFNNNEAPFNIGAISVGQEKTIEVRATIPTGVKLVENRGTVTIADAPASDSFALQIKTQPSKVSCKDGIRGTALRISDIDFDEDEYKPGDIIKIDVEVENNGDDDLDVVLEAFLYNLNTGDELDDFEDQIDIDEGDDDTFNVELTIPLDNDDVKSGHDLVVFFKAYDDGNEDEECTEDREDVDFNLERHDIKIKSVNLLPSALACGELTTVTVDLINIGERDESVWVEIRNSELNIKESTTNFDLDEFDDDDNSAIRRFTITIPENIQAKQYLLNVIAFFDGGSDSTDTFVPLTVTRCGEVIVTPPPPPPQQNITTTRTTPITGAAGFLPTGLFTRGTMSTIFWIIGDLVLLIIAIYFIKLIFTRR